MMRKMQANVKYLVLMWLFGLAITNLSKPLAPFNQFVNIIGLLLLVYIALDSVKEYVTRSKED